MNTLHFRSLLLALLTVAALCASSNALAHARLVSATPAAGSHASDVTHIELVFNEPLVPRASTLVLNRIEGDRAVPVEHVEVTLPDDGKTLRATPAHELAQGDYRVEWRVVGRDNHVITGSHTFMVH